jgi:hypothetical protein
MLGRSSGRRWDGTVGGRGGWRRAWQQRSRGALVDVVQAGRGRCSCSVQRTGAPIGPEAASSTRQYSSGLVRGTARASPCRRLVVWLGRREAAEAWLRRPALVVGDDGAFFELGVGSSSCFIAAPLRLPRCCLGGHTGEMSRETDGRVWSVETVHHARAGWVESARTP